MVLNHELDTARRIMYGNLLPMYPTVTLDTDSLDGTTYKGVWDADSVKLKTECDHIFTDKADVYIKIMT